MTIKTTGDVREILAQALEKAAAGDLSATDGKNMIGLANQICHSMTAEIKQQAMQTTLGRKCAAFGSTKINK